MPELPDVEVFKRYLDSTSLHQKIKDVHVTKKRVLKGVSAPKLKKHLKGHSLESSRRYGKYLFVKVNTGRWLVVHFGMTGFLQYFKASGKKPEHTRFLLDFSNGYHLAYDSQRMLGELYLIENVEKFIDQQELGPDALVIDAASFLDLLKGRKGSIKTTLMNQNIIAGIGNVYSDEILFQAGIHPKKSTGELDKKELGRLFRMARKVLEKAIEAQANPKRLPRSYIIPRRSEGAKCPKCGGAVKKLKFSGRTGYFCPRCQT